MFGRLMPREGKFFEYFSEHADQLVLGARELKALMANVSELPERKRSIEKIEHRADKITQQTMQLLHATFITPLDRDEIHQLITRMDDILDLMEDVSQCMFLYDISETTDEARKLADICLVSTEKVKVAVVQLSDLKNSQAILALCKEIDQLESDAGDRQHEIVESRSPEERVARDRDEVCRRRKAGAGRVGERHRDGADERVTDQHGDVQTQRRRREADRHGGPRPSRRISHEPLPSSRRCAAASVASTSASSNATARNDSCQRRLMRG